MTEITLGRIFPNFVEIKLARVPDFVFQINPIPISEDAHLEQYFNGRDVMVKLFESRDCDAILYTFWRLMSFDGKLKIMDTKIYVEDEFANRVLISEGLNGPQRLSKIVMKEELNSIIIALANIRGLSNDNILAISKRIVEMNDKKKVLSIGETSST